MGSERIVIGMREAIRHTRSSHLSRKEIADFAGVTPPLVTYYFADRNALLEAATLPVVKRFAEEVRGCLTRTAPFEKVLWDIIELILDFRAREGSVLDAYARLRTHTTSQKANPLTAVDNMLKQFFENWLKGRIDVLCLAELSQVSLVSMCKYLSRKPIDSDRSQVHVIYWVVMCIVGSVEKPSSILGGAERANSETRDIASGE